MLFVSRYTRGCGWAYDWPDTTYSNCSPAERSLNSQDARPSCSSYPIDRGVACLVCCERQFAVLYLADLGFYHGHPQQGWGQGAVITSVTVGKLVLRPQLLMLGIFPLHACSSLHNVQTISTEYFFLLFYHLLFILYFSRTHVLISLSFDLVLYALVK